MKGLWQAFGGRRPGAARSASRVGLTVAALTVASIGHAGVADDGAAHAPGEEAKAAPLLELVSHAKRVLSKPGDCLGSYPADRVLQTVLGLRIKRPSSDHIISSPTGFDWVGYLDVSFWCGSHRATCGAVGISLHPGYQTGITQTAFEEAIGYPPAAGPNRTYEMQPTDAGVQSSWIYTFTTRSSGRDTCRLTFKASRGKADTISDISFWTEKL